MRKGSHHTEEAKRKNSEAHKGRKLTEKHKRKISNGNKGKPGYWQGRSFSEEHRQNLSKAQQGREFSAEHKQNLSIAKMGHPVSEQTRRKLSETTAAAWERGDFGEEWRRKQSKAHKGRKLAPFSEEHRRRLSEANKGNKPWNTGKHRSEATKRKLSLIFRGRVRGPHSTEAKDKIRMATTNNWAAGVYANNSYPSSVDYNGIPMRSTWESRLAAVFDAWGWQWKYEPRRFQYKLDDRKHTYTPDFYVPELDCYFDPHHHRWGHNPGKFNAVRKQCGINLIVLDESLLKAYEEASQCA